MIPFGPGEIPINSTEASQRLESAIQKIVGKSGNAKIDCVMKTPGEVSLLSIDITNLEGAASRAKKPSSLTELGEVVLGEFSVTGNPTLVYGAPVEVEIQGKNIPATWSRDDHGDLWLVPSRSAAGEPETAPASGHVELSGAASDLEAVVRAAATEAAEANGARLKDLQLRIESAGPRALLVAVDVVAAKFMMNAKVRALAEASLDDEMNLRVSRVDLTGEGTAGNMVANFLKPRITAWNGRQIALGQYMFAGAALRDVQLEVGEQLRFSARFGQ